MSDTLDAALADIARTTGLVFTHTVFGPQHSGHWARTRTDGTVVITDDDEQALIDNSTGRVAPSNPHHPPIHPIVIAVYATGDITCNPRAQVYTRRADIAVLPPLLDQVLELADRAHRERRDFDAAYDGRDDNERRQVS